MRDVYQAAEDLLTAVIDKMTTAGVSLPVTSYVAPGSQTAYDGEQITVNVNRIFSGQPGAEGVDPFLVGHLMIVSVEFAIVIVRFTPDITDDGSGGVIMPKVTDIQASAQQMLGDVRHLTQALIDIKTTGVMGPTGAFPVSAGPVTTDGPQGGVVATIGLFTMPLL